MTVTIDAGFVSLAAMIISQFVGFAWLLSRQNSRIGSLEEWRQENKDVAKDLRELATIQEQIVKSLDRVVARMDKWEDRERDK